jgi:hypothetical protein
LFAHLAQVVSKLQLGLGKKGQVKIDS